MRSNRARDTKPELAIRRLLHAAGYRYRVHYPPGSNKRRKADIVFTRARIAIFVDGCFWHGCPEHATIPQAHAEYWVPKLERNKSRDAETTSELISKGWTVIRVWEHTPPEIAAARIADAVKARRRL